MNLNSNVTELLNYITNLEEPKKERLNKILEVINSLDIEYKNEFFENILGHSLSELANIEEKINKKECELYGHLFADWECSFLTFEEENYVDKPREIKYWKRTCVRCKVIDVSSIEPKELKNEKSR